MKHTVESWANLFYYTSYQLTLLQRSITFFVWNFLTAWGPSWEQAGVRRHTFGLTTELNWTWPHPPKYTWEVSPLPPLSSSLEATLTKTTLIVSITLLIVPRLLRAPTIVSTWAWVSFLLEFLFRWSSLHFHPQGHFRHWPGKTNWPHQVRQEVNASPRPPPHHYHSFHKTHAYFIDLMIDVCLPCRD